MHSCVLEFQKVSITGHVRVARSTYCIPLCCLCHGGYFIIEPCFVWVLLNASFIVIWSVFLIAQMYAVIFFRCSPRAIHSCKFLAGQLIRWSKEIAVMAGQHGSNLTYSLYISLTFSITLCLAFCWLSLTVFPCKNVFLSSQIHLYRVKRHHTNVVFQGALHSLSSSGFLSEDYAFN